MHGHRAAPDIEDEQHDEPPEAAPAGDEPRCRAELADWFALSHHERRRLLALGRSPETWRLDRGRS